MLQLPFQPQDLGVVRHFRAVEHHPIGVTDGVDPRDKQAHAHARAVALDNALGPDEHARRAPQTCRHPRQPGDRGEVAV